MDPEERSHEISRRRMLRRIGVGAEVAGRVVVAAALAEPVGHHAVGLEDPVQAAELRRHVGDGEARVGGELLDAVAAVFDGALHRDGIAAEQAEGAKDHFLAAESEGQGADIGHRARNPDRDAGDPGLDRANVSRGQAGAARG